MRIIIEPMNTKEVDALIKLLDDPDEEIARHVESKLLSLGNEAVPYLEQQWEQSFDGFLQERLENIIHKIQFEHVKKDLRTWFLSGAFDLLQGVLIVNKYQYPDLDEQKIINQIENIKRDAWMQMNYDMSPVEKVKILNHVFYTLHGFSGNTVNHQDPQNSYLNQVIETKKGNQISLAIIYSLLAQKLDIPIFGVNLPQHFILAYKDDSQQMPDDYEMDNGILFYINAFNKGFIFKKRDVDYFLKQLNIPPQDDFYQPCSNTDIVKRIIRNLVSSYEKLGYNDKALELKELADALEA